MHLLVSKEEMSLIFSVFFLFAVAAYLLYSSPSLSSAEMKRKWKKQSKSLTAFISQEHTLDSGEESGVFPLPSMPPSTPPLLSAGADSNCLRKI